MLASLGWVVSITAVFEDSGSLGWPDTNLLPSRYAEAAVKMVMGKTILITLIGCIIKWDGSLLTW